MKWEEIDYFLEKLSFSDSSRILDIGCGNGRFLGALKNEFSNITSKNYLGVDLSTGLLEEAKKIHGDFSEIFLEINMLDINNISNKITDIFFIASFHHLQSLEDREEVLQKAYNLLEDGGKIYMTNWALNSSLNIEKYKKSIIANSQNSFGSLDYSIKIGENTRYYHCFNLDEIKYLAEKSGFSIIENKLFDNGRNFITILEK